MIEFFFNTIRLFHQTFSRKFNLFNIYLTLIENFTLQSQITDIQNYNNLVRCVVVYKIIHY